MPNGDGGVGGGGVRALLFDLGGVVIDIDFTRAFGIWADRSSSDATDLERRFTFGEAYQQHERGELEPGAYLEALRAELGVGLSDHDLIAGWNDIYLGPVPGMAALLARAGEHFPLYALTNTNSLHQSVWSARFADELSVFRSIFVSSQLGMRKPDPEVFAVVADRIGVPVSEILFFDDTAENIVGAVASGMGAVLVRSMSDVRRALLRLGIDVGG
jgi:putative hydrolase of the HAD superfamily